MKKGMILEIDGDSYTVVEPQLGQGAAGTVCGVRSLVDDKVYALKQIKKASHSERNERFRREIAFGMDSKNDHVVKIHARSDDDKYFYYVMDLYPKNLRDIIDEESDYWVLLDYLSQLCDGLAYVHDHGMVHRDIKPENILVDSDSRRVVLADFGIAHFNDSSLTQNGELLANRNYQAPEQMVKNNAQNVGMPADIFALGLIFAEVLTKQNARGARRRRVSDVYPLLTDLDPLIESMMLQDETQRITVQAVRDSLKLIRRRIGVSIEEIVEELRPIDERISRDISTTDLILEQAGTDVLSAKYIFERTTEKELSRYNPNYHCEISYSVSDELYNVCVQSRLYSVCKAKFDSEANGGSSESDYGLIVSPLKADLLKEFESIQSQYPLARNSILADLPSMAVRLFRFCKDYHCQEIIDQVNREFAVPYGPYNGSLHSNLMKVPILWIAQRVRWYLETDAFEALPQNLHEIEFERQVRIDWEETDFDDSERRAVGLDLFEPDDDAETLAVLKKFSDRWDASFAKQNDGSYLIHFKSFGDYENFKKDSLAVAAKNYIFEGDVLDLLRTDDKFDDLVSLTWGSAFDVPNTLAKILGLREI